MSDYHLHLHEHEPAAGGPPPGEYPPGHIEAYVEAAARRGVTELGFTEHLYRCVEAAPVLGPWWEGETDQRAAAHTAKFVLDDRNLSLDGYVTAVEAAKERGLPVLLGLEVDFFPDTIDAVLELIEPYPWDFLIGAVHWVGGWAIDSATATFGFETRGVGRVYQEYFELEAQLAASGAVDVLAHVDVIKKYGYRLPAPPLDLYRMVVDGAVASGTAVEVSSQGLRNPAAEVYPAPRFLRMFHDAGVPITLASDGHSPAAAAWGHAAVVEAARAAGYEQRLRFRRRERDLVSL